jgi:hypothetical protein
MHSKQSESSHSDDDANCIRVKGMGYSKIMPGCPAKGAAILKLTYASNYGKMDILHMIIPFIIYCTCEQTRQLA